MEKDYYGGMGFARENDVEKSEFSFSFPSSSIVI